MPEDRFDDNWNRDGDESKRGLKDDFAQTKSYMVTTPYKTLQDDDRIMCRGMIIDENAHALKDCTVEFWDQWLNNRLYATKTNENGEWFLSAPSDQYRIIFSKDDLYDEVHIMAIIPQTDRVQEFDTVQIGFNPPEFRMSPKMKYFIKQLRSFLRDTNPNIYQLDDKKFLYSNDDLSVFVHMALNDVNSYPAKTSMDLDSLPQQWNTLIVMGGAIFALISRGLLENQNQFNYSDAGLQVTIQRAAHYQSTEQALFTQYVEAKKIVKAQWKMSPFVLMRSATPFHIRTMAPRQWRLR